MKKKLTALLFISAAFLLAACQKSFLEKAPISNANEDNFYKTEEDFILAMNGAYQALTLEGTYNDFFALIGDLRSDNSTMGSTAGQRTSFREVDEFKEQSVNFILSSIWNDHYAGIARCNKILNRLENGVLGEEKKATIRGEAFFLRSLFYFNLVRVFGDVPLVTTSIEKLEEAYALGRTPIDQVYQTMIADLSQAATDLPAVATEKGRATSGAAKSLLGKIYLTLRRFPEASSILKEVIDGGQYSLLPVFADLWNPQQGNSAESIFEVQYKLQSGFNTGSQYSIHYTPYLSGTVLIGISTTGGGYNIPTEEMIHLYGEEDTRAYSSVAEGYEDANGNYVSGLEGRYTRKYLGKADANLGADDNWKVIRYADVLLMYAEALNEQNFVADGEAFQYLNEVRKRAGLKALSVTSTDLSLQIANQQAFRNAIYQERRKELAFEGHRWFDLVRTGTAIETMAADGTTIQPYQLLFPVPQAQIDINPKVITQNEGY